MKKIVYVTVKSYINFGCVNLFQPVLTPNVSNTIAWSVALASQNDTRWVTIASY